MQKRKTWMVRAGRASAFFEEFAESGLVALGWSRMAEAPASAPRAELKRLFREQYPEVPESRAARAVGQVARFLGEFEIGDRVITYDGNLRRYWIGEVTSAPKSRDHEQGLYRDVSWTTQILRDALTERTKNGLGSLSTLFLVREDVTEELLAKAVALDAELVAAPRTPPAAAASGMGGEEEPDEEALLGGQEIGERANELLSDRLAALGWEEMEWLVAGILRAMGFKTRVSEVGPDRGVDVFASPDGLGLTEPRIFVEVKHHRGAIGAPAVRSFLGGRQPGDRCLYVSTGGFSKDARYEADRSTIPLTLLTLADLRDLYVQHYERLDPETAAMVPLRRVWWPADD